MIFRQCSLLAFYYVYISSSTDSYAFLHNTHKPYNKTPYNKIPSSSTLFASTTLDGNGLGNNNELPVPVPVPVSLPNFIGKKQKQSTKAYNDVVDDVKVGVLLLNLGGPEKTDDVEGMFYILFIYIHNIYMYMEIHVYFLFGFHSFRIFIQPLR